MNRLIWKKTVAICLILIMTMSLAACNVEKHKGKPSMIRNAECESLED